MRILITGANGQLGVALQRVLTDHELTLIDLPEVDITDRATLPGIFATAAPELVIHCAAYTCLLYTSPSPRDRTRSRMPSSA